MAEKKPAVESWAMVRPEGETVEKVLTRRLPRS